MRSGRRLGIDVGDARIGVAVCDPGATLATPVETVPADDAALAHLIQLGAEYEVIEFVVGLPRSLAGGEGPAAKKVRAWAAALQAAVSPLPVRLVDERMSTVTAAGHLRQSGRRDRKRAVIDQAAATVILQSALDIERTSGRPPGESLEDE